mgnify:CR=1 FL=1
MEAPSNSFILANTQAMSLAALGSEHIIPVFAKTMSVPSLIMNLFKHC